MRSSFYVEPDNEALVEDLIGTRELSSIINYALKLYKDSIKAKQSATSSVTSREAPPGSGMRQSDGGVKPIHLGAGTAPAPRQPDKKRDNHA